MAKEYIEREALLKEIDEELEYESKMFTTEQNEYIYKGLRIAKKDIEYFPSADVAEVVRCKDCKYYEIGKSYTPYCNNMMNLFEEMKSDDYCSYGERKTD